MAGAQEVADRLVKIFQAFDGDGDGTISPSELSGMLVAVSKKNDHPLTAEDTDRLMKAIDTNCDGKIQFSEFVSYIMGVQQNTFEVTLIPSEETMEGFQIMDHECDGRLPKDILQISGVPDYIEKKWNPSHPDAQMKVDDRILSINGVSGAEAMKEQFGNCWNQQPCTLTMVRSEPLSSVPINEEAAAPQRLPDGTPIPAFRWGITKAQLAELHAKCRADGKWDDGDSIADFVVKFVKPVTDGTGMGMALFTNQDDPKLVDLMVSHAWQENAGRFFEDLQQHMKEDEVAFVCALALWQHGYEEIKAQLGPSLVGGPFSSVIASVKKQKGRMLVVANEELKENGQGLYSRMWCVWEVFFARNLSMPVEFTHRNSLEHLFGAGGAAASAKTARCGNPAMLMNDDEKRIREAIERGCISFQKIEDDGSVSHQSVAAYSTDGSFDASTKDGKYQLVDYFIKKCSTES